MRVGVLAITFLAGTVLLTAQRRELTIDAGTPEGAQLQQIGQESDQAKKLQMLEKFATDHPQYEGIAWVYAQMQPLYIKQGNFQKAIDAGEKVLAADPEDVRMAHETLKAAEGTKDPDLILKWSNRGSDVARKIAASTKPSEDEDEEQWKQRVDFAKQFDTYTEYALYAALLRTPDPGKKVMLGEALEKRNPESQYVPQMAGPLFFAYQQSGAKDKALALAEKTLQKEQTNEDMLLAVADHYMNQKDAGKVLLYSGKLIELMQTKPRPEGTNEADWEKKKDLSLGVGYWMQGMTYMSQNKFADAEKSLRASLPHIKGNDQLMPSALFNLGLANHKLKRNKEAVTYFSQCSKYKSPYRAQALQNLTALGAR
ncbi:MAG: tetratricopeptide repeat protein [Bryobacteraceae bacterium]|nr:tetratricopeptide repeat protein [Bryobacterales bacterium]MEB2362666.1 tetratricopeptide repeat protein [Bryobacterales bacterium]NUN00773.1 tetratricopeptide repeat protein [Bryobacteraceae bacterium]